MVDYCRIKVQFTREGLAFSLYMLYTFLIWLWKFPKWLIFPFWKITEFSVKDQNAAFYANNSVFADDFLQFASDIFNLICFASWIFF